MKMEITMKIFNNKIALCLALLSGAEYQLLLEERSKHLPKQPQKLHDWVYPKFSPRYQDYLKPCKYLAYQ